MGKPWVLGVACWLAATEAGASNEAAGEVETIEEVGDLSVSSSGEIAPTSEDALVWDPASQVWQERAFVVPLPRTTREGALLFLVDHRNGAPVDRGDDSVHDLFGFDAGGLKVGLGLRYGIVRGWDAGVYRLNGTAERFDVYQFTTKFQPLREADHFLDAAIEGDVLWFSQQRERDASGIAGSLVVGKSLFQRMYLSVGVLYAGDSTASGKTERDEDASLAAIGSASARITDGLALAVETAIPAVGYAARSDAWAAGFKFITHRHSFALLLTNTQYTSADGLAAGSAAEMDSVAFGFNITREFELGAE